MFGYGNYMGIGMSDCYPYYANSAMLSNDYGTPSIITPVAPDKFIREGGKKEDSPMTAQSKTAKVIAYGTLGTIAAALILRGKLSMSKYTKSEGPGFFRKIFDNIGDKKRSLYEKLDKITAARKARKLAIQNGTAKPGFFGRMLNVIKK